MSSSGERYGLWLVGACGSVASTTALGLAALRRGLIDQTGLVTAAPPFARAGLPDLRQFVVGGHEIRRTTIRATLQELHRQADLFDVHTLQRCEPELQAAQKNVRPGTVLGAQPIVRRMNDLGRRAMDRTAAAALRRLAGDIRSFIRRHRLRHCVVVHLASTEPPFRIPAAHSTWPRLEKALNAKVPRILPPSCLYALAAFQAGAAFIDFTPSCALAHPAVRDLAARSGAAYMGRDGKTGETLLKSALAPMFAARNLRILSWSGYNILGGGDGRVLDDHRHKLSKLRSKDRLIGAICGYRPETRVSIDRVDSLHDRKTAWDFVHFLGFLNVRMSLQFTWQGSDSALAAPLVIDLARLTVRFQQLGQAGCMSHLACFFKDPLGSREHDLFRQTDRLAAWVAGSVSTRGRARN